MTAAGNAAREPQRLHHQILGDVNARRRLHQLVEHEPPGCPSCHAFFQSSLSFFGKRKQQEPLLHPLMKATASFFRILEMLQPLTEFLQMHPVKVR